MRWNALRIMLPILSLATASTLSLAHDSDTQGASAFKNDLSRSAVTKMPAFNVNESNSAKTHTLFMGADIAINLDRDMYRVNDVFGSNWVVEINGRQRQISAKQAPVNLKITPNLKLTEVSATIVGFTRVQAYSFGNDPSVLLTKGLSRSSALNSDLIATAQNAQNTQDALQNHALGGASLLAGSDDQFSANTQFTDAQYAFSNLHTTGVGADHLPLPSKIVPTSTNTSGYVALPGMQIFANVNQQISVGIAQQAAIAAANQTEMGDEATGKIVSAGMDAMDVNFDVHSGKPLQNPYVVTMTRFRLKGSKPGMVQNMVYAQSIHPIDEHLSHVHFVEEGFPVGYELLDFQLHLYNRGEEIATNISSDRVELTRDEAFEYVKMEYIGAHKKDTLPAVPAMGKLPANLRSRLAAGKYRETIYVRVAKEGLANEAFLDAACSRRAGDPYLDSVVQSIRFKPALDKGQPVQGIAAVDLNQLTI